MCRFNSSKAPWTLRPSKFQYILCVGLTVWMANLGTTIGRFQYILCVGLTVYMLLTDFLH